MFVQAKMDSASPSRWAVAVSGMFAIASAFTLMKGAASLHGGRWSRQRHVWLSVASLVWYVLARLFLSQSMAFAGAFVALALLLLLASYEYLRLARDRRWFGAAAIGVMLAVIGSANVVVAADELARRVAGAGRMARVTGVEYRCRRYSGRHH